MGSEYVAFLTYDELQLSRETYDRRQTSLSRFHTQFAVDVAMWEMPEESADEFTEIAYPHEAHGIATHVLHLRIRLTRIDKQDARQTIGIDV